MRFVVPGPVDPPLAARYLLVHEHSVVTVRQHPARLLPAVTAAVGGLLAAETVNGIAAGVKWAPFVVWVLAGLLVVRAVVDCLAWSIRYIVITDRRLILISGILSRKVAVLPLQALQNLGLTRSFGGQILGYGAFTAEVDGQAGTVIDFIPYPEQLYLEVYQLLFPRKKGEEDGSGGGPGGLGWPGDPGGPGGSGGSGGSGGLLDFDDL